MSAQNPEAKGKTFATILIGLIILAFTFTGYQQFSDGGSNLGSSVATVDGTPIKPEEFQTEYNRQIEFYKQFMGANVSAKQLQSMGIKESTSKNIVPRKLMSKFSNDLGTFPSDDEVKKMIKELPYFQTNGQFDLGKYKQILMANRLTPHDFENDVINQIKMQKLQTTFAKYPVSKGYLTAVDELRKKEVNAEIVSFSKNGLSKFLPVTEQEIKDYLANETNAKRIESMFNEKKASLSKPEEVEASHILLTTEGKDEATVKAAIEKLAKETTPANFAAQANKYTEDPSGKTTGGSLGRFGHGMMVPEFDQVAFSQKPGTISLPVKTNFGYHLILVKAKHPAVEANFADYKNDLAREVIQKDRVEEIKKLASSIEAQLKDALAKGNNAEVKNLVAKYKLNQSTTTINRVDGAANGAALSTEQMQAIFSGDLTKSEFHSFDDGITATMVRTTGMTAPKLADAGNHAGLEKALDSKMLDSIMKDLEAKAKIKVNQQMMDAFN